MFVTTTQTKRTICKRVLIVFLTLILSACRTAPIYNAKHIPISPDPSATEQDIEKAIWSAGRRLDWRIKKIRQGEMRGVYKKPTYTATVSIPYDRTQFSIIYVGSENLEYDGHEIHENYNVWIQRLADQIQNYIEYPPL